MPDNLPQAPQTEEFKDCTIQQLEEHIRDLRPQVQQFAEIAESRPWEPSEEEQAGKCLALLTEATSRHHAMEEKRKQQAEMIAAAGVLDTELPERREEKPRRSASGLPSTEVNRPSQFNAEYQHRISQIVEEQFGRMMEAVPQFNTVPENVPTSFRNGGPGQYTRFNESSIMIDQNAYSTDVLACEPYMEAFRRTIKNGLDAQSFMQFLHSSWDRVAECCDTPNATPSDFATGGYLLTPLQFVDGLQKCCDKLVVMGQISNVVTVTQATRLGVRRLKTRMSSFSWGNE
jgi:hypothetical protein